MAATLSFFRSVHDSVHTDSDCAWSMDADNIAAPINRREVAMACIISYILFVFCSNVDSHIYPSGSEEIVMFILPHTTPFAGVGYTY